MYCLSLQSHDPHFNLAVEEYLLKKNKEEFLILGINSQSVIIGKHQTPHREVDTEYVTKNNIPVLRRISGGGTVFHDLGNLNFTFIKNGEPGRQVDFPKYTKPVIEFLASLGIQARFEGKNDLKVNGLKISGNAEHIHRDRVLHHGTLLFSTTLEILRNSLRKDTTCYSTRAVESNPSSVLNLNDHLPGIHDVFEFREIMMNYLFNTSSETKKYNLSEEDIRSASLLADSKYRTWEWTWAYSPEYQFTNLFDYQTKRVLCKLKVKDGIIHQALLEGDSKLAAVAKKLIGHRHAVNDINDFFRKENISDIEIYDFF